MEKTEPTPRRTAGGGGAAAAATIGGKPADLIAKRSDVMTTKANIDREQFDRHVDSGAIVLLP